ncbi:hypothetical protein C8Q79DRAFT_1067554 [Trametes meyenii]|nr:hypothetical protein C8Q79DRAFT_1067554 [Trametes meyenii]
MQRFVRRAVADPLWLVACGSFCSQIRIVNDNKLAGDLLMACSSEKPDMKEVDENGQKIDAAFFKEDDLPLLHDGRPRWADQIICVEFKRHETNKDPFDDWDEEQTDANSQARKEARGQIITYAEQVFRVQQRTALFMLLVIGRNFRIVRWDRSGAIVTRALDYVEHPGVLCGFLWRMSLQSDEALGVDPSATRLRPEDADFGEMDEAAKVLDSDLATEERVLTEAEVRAGVQVFKYIREWFRLSLHPAWPRYRVEVPDGDKTRLLLIGRPLFYAHGMAGRGTRGYVALDCSSKRFVWLKDAWRVHYDLVDQEGTILALLNDKHVRNVPTLLCHGDIRNQTTDTPRVWEEKHPPKPLPTTPGPSTSSLPASPLRHHMHYCIVEREVAMPLSEFQHGKQLVSIVLDAIVGMYAPFTDTLNSFLMDYVAHWDAHDNAGIMHRDVSGGNVLIYPRVEYDPDTNDMFIRWTGLLADWEMSKPVWEKEEFLRPRQPPRTGTWQFLSVAMLSSEPGPIEVPDEMESFLHVILYHGLRYLKSNCATVPSLLEGFFDAYNLDENGVYTCGDAKAIAIEFIGEIHVRPGVQLVFDSPLDSIFKKLLPRFKARYKVRRYEKSSLDSSPPRKAPLLTPQDDAPSHSSKPKPKYQKAGRYGLLPRSPSPDPQEAKVNPPNPEERAAATRVSKHDFVAGVLDEALETGDWLLNDKIGDQVPYNYKPQYPLAPGKGAAPSTIKRQKTATTGLIDHCHISCPPVVQPPRSAYAVLTKP